MVSIAAPPPEEMDKGGPTLHQRALHKRRKDGYVSDTFLKLIGPSGPIQGESTDESHANEIEVDAFEFDLRGSAALGEDNSVHVGGVWDAHDLYFVMRVNKATVALWNWLLKGEAPMPKAILTCRKAGRGGADFLVVTMEHVSVAQIKTIDTGEDDPTPINFVHLVSDRLKMEYQEVKPEGSASGKHAADYDFKTHKPQ